MRHSTIKTTAFLCALVAGLTVSPVNAADDLVITKNKDSVVSGTIEEIGESSVVIDSDGNQIRVDLDEFDLGESIDDLLQPGMKITAQGKFEDFGTIPNFKAETVVRDASGGAEDAPAQLLPRN